MGRPCTWEPWSQIFVAYPQGVLRVGLRKGAMFWMNPMHANSRHVALPPSAKPAEVVLDVLKSYPLGPIVVHSTSWRHEDGRIVLTYIAVVEPPSSLPPDSLLSLPVGRTELARGEAMSAPRSIAVDAVLEH